MAWLRWSMSLISLILLSTLPRSSWAFGQETTTFMSNLSYSSFSESGGVKVALVKETI